MNDTEFLEKLLRLAWKNGYEYLTSYGTNHYIELLEDKTDGYLLKIYSKKTDYFLYTVNIERIIFDHDFIKILIKLLHDRDVPSGPLYCVLSNLANSENRIEYLRKEFEGLIE